MRGRRRATFKRFKRRRKAADGTLGRAILHRAGIHHVFLVHTVAEGAGNIDDGAATARIHVGYDSATHEKSTLDVNLEQRLPSGRVDFAEAYGVGRVYPARSIDQNVDAAKTRHGFVDKGLHRLPIRDVEMSSTSDAAHHLDLMHCLVRYIRAVAVGKRDVGTFAPRPGR